MKWEQLLVYLHHPFFMNTEYLDITQSNFFLCHRNLVTKYTDFDTERNQGILWNSSETDLTQGNIWM